MDGLYAFTAISDGHRAIVTLIDGSRCEDQELGCNAAGEAEFTSEVVRTLDAGQLVSVYVDGVDGSGTFELDIKPVAAACSSEVLPEETLVTATYETRTMSSSCSSVEIRNGVNLAQEMNDKTFQIDVPKAPTGCSGSCDIIINSDGLFSAALLEGADCGGAEEQCKQGIGSASIQISVDDIEERTQTLIVTDQDTADFGGFTVEMFCGISCA